MLQVASSWGAVSAHKAEDPIQRLPAVGEWQAMPRRGGSLDRARLRSEPALLLRALHRGRVSHGCCRPRPLQLEWWHATSGLSRPPAYAMSTQTRADAFTSSRTGHELATPPACFRPSGPTGLARPTDQASRQPSARNLSAGNRRLHSPPVVRAGSCNRTRCAGAPLTRWSIQCCAALTRAGVTARLSCGCRRQLDVVVWTGTIYRRDSIPAHLRLEPNR
jgi:hypothetical protein